MAEVIVALDVPSAKEAVGLVDRLPGLRWAKVGPMLFLRAGHEVVAALRERGIRVFLDLKWHDIPNSVAEAVRAAADLGVDLATVHSLGGRAMLEAAVAAKGPLRLAGVTILTSHTLASYQQALGSARVSELSDEVVRMAALVTEVGVDAVVASPHEVAAVRDAVGLTPWIVTPGIRPAGHGVDDQRRTSTPEAAVAAGATHLVVGRPISRAKHPGAVYQSIVKAVS